MAFSDLSPEDKRTILEHLSDLRKSLIISMVAVIIAAMVCFCYSEQLLSLIILPLTQLSEQLVVTGVTEAFFVKLKLSFIAGFIVAFPVVVIACWTFIKPALYSDERKYIYILFPIIVLLFLGGIIFAYFGVLQMILKFFIFMAGENLESMFKVDQYVSFILSFTIPFGLVFELPVFVYSLSKIGIISHQGMIDNRKYALLVIVILGAAFTPGGDPFSMLMMAVPVYLLYEISIIVAKLSRPGKERKNKGNRLFKKNKDLHETEGNPENREK